MMTEFELRKFNALSKIQRRALKIILTAPRASKESIAAQRDHTKACEELCRLLQRATRQLHHHQQPPGPYGKAVAKQLDANLSRKSLRAIK